MSCFNLATLPTSLNTHVIESVGVWLTGHALEQKSACVVLLLHRRTANREVPEYSLIRPISACSIRGVVVGKPAVAHRSCRWQAHDGYVKNRAIVRRISPRLCQRRRVRSKSRALPYGCDGRRNCICSIGEGDVLAHISRIKLAGSGSNRGASARGYHIGANAARPPMRKIAAGVDRVIDDNSESSKHKKHEERHSRQMKDRRARIRPCLQLL